MPDASRQTLRALDATNFLMADTATGVGPFLAIYLASALHWKAGDIGIAMAVGGVAAIIAQTPAGALVDRLPYKREGIAIGAILVALGCLTIIPFHSFFQVIANQALLGAVGTFFPPAMAGMTLGIVGAAGLDRRIGRNETFNHAGNVFCAACAGLAGYLLSKQWIFYVVAIISLLTAVTVFLIRGEEIDFARARGCADGEESQDEGTTGYGEVVRNRPLLIFIISVVLFHFANAAMLPLVGQQLSAGHAKQASLYMAVCIVGAQVVMVPVALVSGRLASTRGRKAVFLVGFAALPIRGILYTLSSYPAWLIGVQLLDGIGAAIFGVVNVLIIADLTRGTGRFNFTQGVVATATGLGASLSNGIAGFIVQRAGFNAAYLALAGVAAAAFGIFFFLMPETGSAAFTPLRSIPSRA